MSERGMRPPKKEPPLTPDAGFLAVVQQLHDLRKAEERGGAILKRTELLLSLLQPTPHSPQSFVDTYLAQGADVSVWPDTNGLKLDIGPDGAQGIHAHIPYEHIPHTALEALQTSTQVITESALQEISIRIAQAHGDSARVVELSQKQKQTLVAHVQHDTTPASITDETHITEYPEKVATSCIEHGDYIPRTAIQEILTQPDNASENILSLLRVASLLNGGHQGIDGDRFYRAQHPDAWKELRNSVDASRFSKSVYKSRVEQLHTNPHNADVAKILEVLFETHNYSSLAKNGVHAIRGAYKDGVEFVAFFTGASYERVLIDPKKHIRSDIAKQHYDSIPVVPNSDFEAFEGFILPYIQFQYLEKELQVLLATDTTHTEQDIDTIRSYVSGTISLLASHMSPAMYEPFLLRGKELLFALNTQPIDREVTDTFLESLHTIQAQYGERFIQTPIPKILETHLKTPERVAISFGQDFLDGIGKTETRDRAEAFIHSLPLRPHAMLVKSGTESGIPSVLAGRALRALKITARPTLVLIMGAKFEDVDSQSVVDAIAESIIQAGRQTQANIVMQGGQSGKLVETVVRKYWEYRSKLSEGEEPFRIIGIEPGQSTYAGEAGYPQREQTETHPMLPIDSIHTPYVAGWSPGLEDVWEHTYLPHLVYRQELIRYMSEGYPATTLIINGGSWSVPESVESLKDGFTQIVMPETGRLASMLGHLQQTFNEWSQKGMEGAVAQLQTFIAQQPEEKRARMEQDLVLMQKRGLRELISNITTPESITTTDTAHLRDLLVERLSAK